MFILEEGFWKDFQGFAINRGIQGKTIKWYMYWIRQFVRHLGTTPLQKCTLKDVRLFLRHLDGRPDVPEWQMEQARNALRLLFKDFFQFSWAQKKGEAKKNYSSDKSNRRRFGERYTQFKDVLPPKRVTAAYGVVLERMRSEIRVRHYSIRTERTYEQWVRRFLSFINGKLVDDMSADDVKSYLNYLAVERQVSARSQNQALLSAISNKQ